MWYLRNHVEAVGGTLLDGAETLRDPFPFIDELASVDEHAPELFMECGHLHHDVVHALAHGKVVVDEIGRHPGYTLGLVNECLDMRRRIVKFCCGWYTRQTLQPCKE